MHPRTCMDLAGDHYDRGASVPGQKNTLSQDFQALDSLDSVGQLREAALGVGRWTPERAWTLLWTTMPGVHLSQAKKTHSLMTFRLWTAWTAQEAGRCTTDRLLALTLARLLR